MTLGLRCRRWACVVAHEGEWRVGVFGFSCD